MRRFRSGRDVTAEELVTTGMKGAHLQAWSGSEAAGHDLQWLQVADVAVDHRELVERRRYLAESGDDPTTAVLTEVEQAHDRIDGLIAAADGHQVTADRSSTVHHTANVLFNCMRGGIFTDDHRVEVSAVAHFVAGRDRRRKLASPN